MAFKGFLTIIVAAIAASSAFATEYIVGDSEGWKLGVNYTAWAEGKEFYVGDTIIFMYNKGVHNVHKVNGTAFKQCLASPPSLTTGHDEITLATPGMKWYICGIGSHCSSGMKLVITVYDYMEAPVSAPSPSPFPYPSPISPSPSPSPISGSSTTWGKKSMSFWSN